MLKALKLDDDLDPVGVVMEIESAFDIKVSAAEAESIFKVGEMYDLLRKRVHWSDANRKCASAMAFYRIRRAVNDLGVEIGRSPSSDLSPLQDVYTKLFVKALEAKSGLRLPRPDLGPLGKVGVRVLVTAVLGSLALFVASRFSTFLAAGLVNILPAAAAVLFFAGLVAGIAMLKKDAGRLPKEYRALGELAAKAANMNYGRLVKQGAGASDDRLWEVLVKVLSDFSGDPADQIARETYFLPSTLKKHQAAA